MLEKAIYQLEAFETKDNLEQKCIDLYEVIVQTNKVGKERETLSKVDELQNLLTGLFKFTSNSKPQLGVILHSCLQGLLSLKESLINREHNSKIIPLNDNLVRHIASYLPTGEQGKVSNLCSFFNNALDPILAKKKAYARGASRQIKQIATSNFHSLLLKQDGGVLTFGKNDDYQLGLGHKNTQFKPAVIPGLENVCQIATGASHSVFLTNDNKLFSTGEDGVKTQRRPTFVAEISDIRQIAAGDKFTILLKNDGTVDGFGDNNFCPLGEATKGYPNPRLKRPHILTNIRQVAAGARHALFLDSNGEVWGCGDNSDKQLGLKGTQQQETPVKLPGLSGIKQIAAGNDFSLFLSANGKVLVCGNNEHGQLGFKASPSIKTPTLIPKLSNVKSIVAGASSSFLVKVNEIVIHGYNDKHQLGIEGSQGSMNISSIPKQISVGGSHTIMLSKDNLTLALLGSNEYGQLGLAQETKLAVTPLVASLTSPNKNEIEVVSNLELREHRLGYTK